MRNTSKGLLDSISFLDDCLLAWALGEATDAAAVMAAVGIPAVDGLAAAGIPAVDGLADVGAGDVGSRTLRRRSLLERPRTNGPLINIKVFTSF